ncbi:MAG: UPF0280 family protein [Pseudotabrizicola sp.]|uniref:UPF0280 family protein n=1 Tax=Pseudotabrizicola sp. TaxID=2939647 RepID=UPI002719B527|nr:UPF0280 family protein [Pseudotabrizicola sp.]MDO8883573.1 UPF0280 family protein [Pseudotabrizicola sp.]MDP2081226.1 UPF0280 family protein [Pseudotabrizicola sp.]MDZ7576155.1 UPF0280 family protein [Pseudotabrizicola sp.]
MTSATCARLPDGRLHLHHGPIDIIAQAWGSPASVASGEARMVARFGSVLAELASELPELRRESGQPTGPIAQLMVRATTVFTPAFITPMAAVAGAVADVLLAELAVPGVRRAYVNNGGDIALHLDPGESLSCAIAARPGMPDRVTLRAEDTVRGIATSGWRGRSWSCGIADSVSVLAKTSAMADAAATMIANAVNLPDHPGITRRPAHQMQTDSDLGARLVTVAVSGLTEADRFRALNAGEAAAEAFRSQGLIEAAALFLHPEVRTLGPLALKELTCV